MFNQLKTQYCVLLLDMAIVAAVPFLALFVRFDGMVDGAYLDLVRSFIPYIIFFSIIIFYLCGFYQRLWRYATIRDLFALVAAVTVTVALLWLAGLGRAASLPRSLYFISWGLGIGLIGFSRLLIKLTSYRLRFGGGAATRLLIVGAGDAGAMLAREIAQHRSETERRIVGYVDDDPDKWGRSLFGARVLGSAADIARLAAAERIDEIVIAMPSAEGAAIRRIADVCRRTHCKVRVVPGIYELIDGQATLRQLRDIAIDDLLRRDAVRLDMEKIADYIAGRVVLVTGAGGSIGSEICRQLSRVGASRILLLGRGENSIYEIHWELRARYPQQQIVPLIADVRDRKHLEQIFAAYAPEVVFHAAAHKHVPLMEAQPAEAVKNNVFGTRNVAECAARFGCARFVLISTDKAVNPTSVMGATKRAAELVLQEIGARSGTKFAAVRFGNVLGSRGSVVPLFEKQIAAGGPLTITHPEMTRYFMTIPEAAQLVLQAGALAAGGEVFLLDMGKPVKILDLAKDLIALHNLTLGRDIQIAFTGLRPGEKLYEELLTAEEGARRTDHEKIFSARIVPVDQRELKEVLQILREAVDAPTILRALQRLIPTYQSRQLEEIPDGSKVSSKAG